ncbi:MAG TPA: phosphopantetheine-binding protein [Microlunatus sp.]
MALTTHLDAMDVVAELLVKEFDVPVDDVRPEAHLVRDLGLDSLGVLELVSELEDRFDITVLDEEVGHMVVVQDAAEVLLAKVSP